MRKRKIGAGKRAAAALALALTIAVGIAPAAELAAAETETTGEFAEATEDESTTTVTPAAQSADEESAITDEMVAEIKARNEYYRKELEEIDHTTYFSRKSFYVEDFDGDGYEELYIGDYDNVIDIYYYQNDETKGEIPWTFAPMYKGGYYYCAETGYLLKVSGTMNLSVGLLQYICLIEKNNAYQSTGGWGYIPLFSDDDYVEKDHGYCGMDEYHWSAWNITEEEYYAVPYGRGEYDFVSVSEYTDEIQNTLNTCVPISSLVRLEAKFEYNETNLDLFLPVDENLIRARLADPADDSDAVWEGYRYTSDLISVVDWNYTYGLYVISGADGLLGSGDVFRAKMLEDSSVDTAAKTALSETDTAYKNIAVYEFTLTRVGMELHEFSDYLTITFPLPENMSAENSLQIYRLEEDGTLTACETTVSDKYVLLSGDEMSTVKVVSFTTDHLSTYILVETAAEANTGNENQGGSSSLNNNSDNGENSGANGNSTASEAANKGADSVSVSEASSITAPQTGDLPLAGTFAVSAFSGMLGVALIGSIKLRNYRRGQNFKLQR